MITAINYLGTVNRVREDIQTASEVSDTLETALDRLEEFLEVPGKLEDKLRVPEKALDLPAAIVVPLSFAPVIGPAVKTINNISSATSDEIEFQADAMQRLDEAWKPLRTVVDVAQGANDVAGPALTGFSVEHTFRLDEAALLSTSLGNQTIYGGSQLAARITDYTDVADIWFATQEALLAPVRAASLALEQAVAQLAALMPDFGFVDEVLDAVNAVFAPVAKALSDLEDLLCVVATITPAITVPPVTITPAITIPPVYVLGVLVPGTGITIPAVVTPGFTIPAVVVDVCAILETIGNQTDIIISFVEGLVSDALSLIGVDLGGVADDLRDLLLTPLQPIFDVLQDLVSLVDPLIDSISGLVDDLAESLAQIVEDLRDVVDLGSLFENREEGDAGGEVVADEMIGTDGEDALFGLAGADTLSGLEGVDFLFGGAGGDTLWGGDGDDEVYGGAGSDTVNGDAGNDLVDGGRGLDFLNGGAGDDIVIGGGGFDIARGGAGADSFVIMPGSGIDFIADFTDDVDLLLIDAGMVEGAEAGDAPTMLTGRSFAGTTLIKVDGALVMLAGVAFEDIVDDIVLV
jgi:hypothetical protein